MWSAYEKCRWLDLTVPDDAAELAAELRRHGVLPDHRLHIVRTMDAPMKGGNRPSAPPRQRGFVGAVRGGPADLSERIVEYLQGGVGIE